VSTKYLQVFLVVFQRDNTTLEAIFRVTVGFDRMTKLYDNTIDSFEKQLHVGTFTLLFGVGVDKILQVATTQRSSLEYYEKD